VKCPACPEITLVMSDRMGIEIDYCPQCRGVWLDRGELDKLIERSTTLKQENRSKSHAQDVDQHSRKDHYYKKKKSFLSEIFD